MEVNGLQELERAAPITMQQAAELLGCTLRSAMKYKQLGLLPIFRLQGRLLTTAQAVEQCRPLIAQADRRRGKGKRKPRVNAAAPLQHSQGKIDAQIPQEGEATRENANQATQQAQSPLSSTWNIGSNS
jgi:hypothetical protein